MKKENLKGLLIALMMITGIIGIFLGLGWNESDSLQKANKGPYITGGGFFLFVVGFIVLFLKSPTDEE